MAILTGKQKIDPAAAAAKTGNGASSRLAYIPPIEPNMPSYAELERAVAALKRTAEEIESIEKEKVGNDQQVKNRVPVMNNLRRGDAATAEQIALALQVARDRSAFISEFLIPQKTAEYDIQSRLVLRLREKVDREIALAVNRSYCAALVSAMRALFAFSDRCSELAEIERCIRSRRLPIRLVDFMFQHAFADFKNISSPAVLVTTAILDRLDNDKNVEPVPEQLARRGRREADDRAAELRRLESKSFADGLSANEEWFNSPVAR